MNHTQRLTRGGLIAALYVALTFFSSLLGISRGVIQCRLSAALCVLPVFLPEAVPGLFVGCLLATLVTGAPLLDILFGSLATLLGAVGAYLLRRFPLFTPLPTVLANAAIIPPLLVFAYGVPEGYWFCLITVTAGELISAYALGLFLYFTLKKRSKGLFTK